MRGMVLMLGLILLFGAASSAQAQPAHAPYDMQLSLRYRTLTTAQQQLFDLCYDCVWEGKTQLDTPDGARYADMTIAVNVLRDDAPELCALNPGVTFHYFQDTPDVVNQLTFTYDLPVDHQLIVTGVAMNIAGEASGTPYERELFLHDALCAMTTYETAENAHTAFGAIREGRAVCEGYAKAFTLLCRMSGIPCSMITGKALDLKTGEWVGHGWNLVELDGCCVWTDVTWDDQETCSHWYFNLTDEWFGKEHCPDDTFRLPACTSDEYAWYAMSNALVPGSQGDQALFAALARLVRTGEAQELHFEQAQDYARAAYDFEGVWDAYNAQAAPQDQLYGVVLRSYSDNLQNIRISRSAEH